MVEEVPYSVYGSENIVQYVDFSGIHFYSEEQLSSVSKWSISERGAYYVNDSQFYLCSKDDAQSGRFLFNPYGLSYLRYDKNQDCMLFNINGKDFIVPSIEYTYNDELYLLFSVPSDLYFDIVKNNSYRDLGYNNKLFHFPIGRNSIFITDTPHYDIKCGEVGFLYGATPVVVMPQLTIVNGGTEQTLATAGNIALNNGDTTKVKANGFSHYSEYYSESEYSETYTYYNVKHPVVTVDRYGVASWESVENATSYEVYVDNELKTTTTSCTYTLTDGQTIKVKSVRSAAENELVYISNTVNAVTYNKETLATPVVKIDKNGLVIWNTIPNAQKYIIQLLGVYEVENTETSYQLYGGNTVSIEAVGDSNLYNDSEYSERLSYSLTLPNDLREVKVGDDLSGKTLYFVNFNTTYHGGNLQFITTETGGNVTYTPIITGVEYASFIVTQTEPNGLIYDIKGLSKMDSARFHLPDGMGVVTELKYDIKACVSASEMGDPIISDNPNTPTDTNKDNNIGKRLTTVIGLTAGMAVVVVCGLVFILKRKNIGNF